MRIESSYPTPVHGVSTLAPRNRKRGHAGLQVNFRSDPVNKLTRRPAMAIKASLGALNSGGAGIIYHSYVRDGYTYRIIISKTTKAISVYENTTLLTNSIISDPHIYIRGPMVLRTIGHTTYMVNKNRVVTMDAATDEADVARVSHINVLSALNYGETVSVVIKAAGGSSTVSYTVPDLGLPPEYDAADRARATSEVAKQLSLLINAVSNVTSYYRGSTVSVANTDLSEWLSVEVETGQGDRSCVAFNDVTYSTDGLPLYARVGTRVQIRPDPTTDKGTYYLSAERGITGTSDHYLSEVVWTESRNPHEAYRFTGTTVPYSIRVDPRAGTATIDQGNFRDRQTGDNNSVKQPVFVGKTITDIGYLQNRLVFVTENDIIASETDDELNFWKQSAVTLLVNDPVTVASNAVGIDKIQHVIPHNRDMLVIASNGQFKVNGSTPLTPQTASMPLTTTYECQTAAAPVTMGNSVFLPISYGDSTGIIEYTGEKDTSQDFAIKLTRHVVDYMQGDIELMVANSNLEMIALTTTRGTGNELFIFEQFIDLDGSRTQISWSKWVLPTTTHIKAMDFRGDELTIVSVEGTEVVLKSIDMYTRSTTSSKEIFLDDMLRIATTGTTVEIPTGYTDLPFKVIRGEGLSLELFEVPYTVSGTTVTFNKDIGNGFVYIGRPFESRYRPTRPYRYNKEGIAITTDRIRIGRYIVNLVETNEIHMHILSDFYTTDDQVFNSRIVGGITNLIGEVPLYTGDYKFSFAQDANLAEAEFYCDNHLGCTIAGLSWEGQYYKSKGRM